MSTIDFQVNEFRTYEVRVEGLSLGFINTATGGYTPSFGETLQYDGTTVILKDGREFPNVPQLRTAIQTSNWFAIVGTKVTKSRPKAAGIQVRPTETRGNERVIKSTVEIHQSDERTIGSIADRKAAREATNLEAGRRVPLESQEARAAVADGEEYYIEEEAESAELDSTGDEELDDILEEIEVEMFLFEENAEEKELEEDFEDGGEDMKAQTEADILALLDWAESDPDPAPKPTRKAAKKAVPKKAAPTRKSARRLPVDAQDDRKTMPIVRDNTETEGTVVGNVANQKRMVIRREEEIALNLSPAKPAAKSPAPKSRFGSAGAIVVDEQREVSRIKLSSTAAPIRMDESAKVVSGSRESIKMGDGAQVGGRKAASKAPPVTVDGGVAVGRILSPAVRSFVASDANTSSTAIERAQGGKQLRVERYESGEQVVGTVSEGAATTGVATGDVQEAIAGDTLEEVLPDAVKGPTPEVYRRPENDPAYQAVRMLIPEFDWDKDRPAKVKVAAALKHIKNPQYIKGILAVESEVVRGMIKKALAEALEKLAEAKKKG